MNRLTFAFAAPLVLACAHARADEPPTESLRFTNVVGVQMNPRLFGNDLRIRYRHRLYRGEGMLFEQNFAGAVLGVALGAGALRPTVGLELQPLAALTLGVSYHPTFYFGVLGLAQSYPSPRSDYASGVFSQPSDGPRGSYGLVVHQVTWNASVQAKLGSLVVRNGARLTYSHTDPNDGDRVIYDPAYDIAIYRRGWALQNDTDAGYMFDRRVTVGLRHTIVVAWYPTSAFAPDEPHETHDSPSSRLGPFLSYTLFEGQRGIVDSASVSGVAQWYLAHRFRTGEASPAAVPLVGLALTVSGDL